VLCCVVKFLVANVVCFLAALYPGLKPTSFLLVGAGVGTFFLIGVQIGVGPLIKDNEVDLNTVLEYFLPVAALIAAGLVVCFVFARVTRNEIVMAEDEFALLAGTSIQSEPGSGANNQSRTKFQVCKSLILPQVSIFLCTWLQIGAVSLIMFVPNTDPKAFDMPAVLLWSTSIAAFVGSELQSLVSPLKSPVREENESCLCVFFFFSFL
jgi:hypothetical protein